jgi:ADP-heptose:LPS heptosyltransferase
MKPTHILLIKSHSMGIGDVLRSSAAWQALKQRWPDVKLHLLFLSRHPGYPTEQLIREHHLLASAHFISVATDEPGSATSRRLPQAVVARAIDLALQGLPIDLIIDFEPGGMRTTLLTWRLAKQRKVASVGIAQFPFRGMFYTYAAPSVAHYCQHKKLGLPVQMDYTEKDFVALAALGIDRLDHKINLRASADGMAWRQAHLPDEHGKFNVTLNIGCGTRGALPKRPVMKDLVACMAALYRRRGFTLHLSGAVFEAEVNAEFQRDFSASLAEHGLRCDVIDWSGQCTLSQLTGLLGASNLVISSDSGPYHMAVALGVPTLCWFNFDTPPSYHTQPGVATLIQPSIEEFVAAANQVLELA